MGSMWRMLGGGRWGEGKGGRARLAEVAADEDGLAERERGGAHERPPRGGRWDDPKDVSLDVWEQLVRLDEGGDLLEDGAPLGHVAGLREGRRVLGGEAGAAGV